VDEVNQLKDRNLQLLILWPLYLVEEQLLLVDSSRASSK
jgi:hypothetical protein